MAASIDNAQFRNLLFSWPEKALAFLYEDFYDKLIRIADMRTHDRRTSEDVLQEVFADVWRRHKFIGLQRDESIQTYLIRAVEYHSISLYKRNAKAAECQAQYFYSLRNGLFEFPAETEIISFERQSFIRLIIATFPLMERKCLLLQIDHGLRVKEIATRLGIGKKAVERSLTSAKKRMKRFRARLS